MPTHAPTHRSDQEVVRLFKSLGHDCEVGLLQRQLGAEPLGLFRWGGTHIVRLIEALDNNFEGLGAPEHNSIVANAGEYYLEERRYGLSRHTHVRVGSEVDKEKLLKRQLEITGFHLRSFKESLEEGLKVFVYKDFDNASPQVILDLSLALRRYGPARLVVIHQHLRIGELAELKRLDSQTWLGELERFGGRADHWDIATDQWLFVMRGVLAQIDSGVRH